MFSIAEVLAIAVQLEINGEKAYREALAASEDPGLQELLCWMADEERAHAQYFSRLQGMITDEEKSQLVNGMTDSLVESFMSGQIFSLAEVNFSDLRDAGALLDTFIEFEKDTMLFYGMLKSFILDEKVIHQLDNILHEEAMHVNKLQELLLKNG